MACNRLWRESANSWDSNRRRYSPSMLPFPRAPRAGLERDGRQAELRSLRSGLRRLRLVLHRGVAEEPAAAKEVGAERQIGMEAESEVRTASTRRSGNDASASDEATPPRSITSRRSRQGLCSRSLLLWQKSKEDLVKEMDSTIHVPGWSNIFTQPIINRIDMLATGVRTMIGVKVFGDDLDKIQEVSEASRRGASHRARHRSRRSRSDHRQGIPGNQDRSREGGPLRRERRRRARRDRGRSGGQADHEKIENRERYPIRIRYAREARADEEQIKNLLISPAGAAAMGSDSGVAMGGASGGPAKSSAASAARPLQIPLRAWPTCRSSKVRRRSRARTACSAPTCKLNVNTPDLVGYVEQAQRLVDQKVTPTCRRECIWNGAASSSTRFGPIARCGSCFRSCCFLSSSSSTSPTTTSWMPC